MKDRHTNQIDLQNNPRWFLTKFQKQSKGRNIVFSTNATRAITDPETKKKKKRNLNSHINNKLF